MTKEVKYIPRTTPPTVSNLNYVKSTKKGLNYAIEINTKNGFVLPNCVGYAWGRWHELTGTHPRLSTGNAENWWTKFEDGYERGSTPKLGAVACWRKGAVNNSSDGYGHVAIVEDILEDGSIVTSNSAYLGATFYMRTIKPPYSLADKYFFQGFIYPEINFVKELSKPKLTVEEVALQVIQGKWGVGADRKARLIAENHNPAVVQNMVNNILKLKLVPNLKPTHEIVKEVVEGKWGSGAVRKNRLTSAGYDYKTIQENVNLYLSLKNKKKSNLTIAKEVIAGKWGSGKFRKDSLTIAGYNYRTIQLMVNELIKNKR